MFTRYYMIRFIGNFSDLPRLDCANPFTEQNWIAKKRKTEPAEDVETDDDDGILWEKEPGIY